MDGNLPSHVPTTFWAYVLAHPEAAGIVVSAILVIFGWLYNGMLARKLQRKQLAMNILFGSHENISLVNAMQSVFKKINADHDYDWKYLAQCRYDNKQYGADDDALAENLINVLNHFESLAIAVLNGAVDEEVIKLSKRSMVTRLYINVSPFIIESRKLHNAPRYWCQYQRLAERWAEEVPAVQPNG